MRVSRSVPSPAVVPIVVFPDVRAAVAFLTAASDFIERTRIGENHRAQMAVGDDGAVIVADVSGYRSPPAQGWVSQMIRVRSTTPTRPLCAPGTTAQ